MNRCLTCKHWSRELGDYQPGSVERLLTPLHPRSLAQDAYPEYMTEDEALQLLGHRVRYCNHPKVVFYDRPEANGAAVVDGSEYRAALLTGESFGCVLHEPVAPKSGNTHTSGDTRPLQQGAVGADKAVSD